MMIVKGSIEDIIYILIGVLWIAYSIYKGFKSSQKKKQPKTVAEEPDTNGTRETVESKPRKTIFDSFLEEITREEKSVPYTPAEMQPEYQEEKPIQPKTKEVAEPFSYDDFYEESNFMEGSDVYEKERTATEPTKPTKLSTGRKRRRKPRIDLRKAVIYSEILNRRYL
jgi:hypothetical protein